MILVMELAVADSQAERLELGECCRDVVIQVRVHPEFNLFRQVAGPEEQGVVVCFDLHGAVHLNR